MSDTDLSAAFAPAAPEPASARANALYFAIWRWHFYAGLYVVPFLLMLAITGFFMMWFTAIAPEYGDRLAVEPAGQALDLADQQAAALAAVPGTLTGYTAPYDAATPGLFFVTDAQGAAQVVALDPYRGTAVRVMAEGATWNAFAEEIHGTLMIGDMGDRLIEIAASLGLLLVVSGAYLWWPRGGASVRDLFVPRLAARGRSFWKSLHAVTGAWTAILLAFFFVTGLAWAGIWGEKFVQAWSTFPAEKWDNVPLSDATHASMNHAEKEVPWALEQTPMPESGSQAGVTGLAPGVTPDLGSVVALAREIGFDGRFRLSVPADAAGVWTIAQDSMSYDSPDPTADRTVHVDQFTGKVLADVRFADYALAGKAMAVGIALHEGQTGLWNVILNGLFCLAIVTLCLSGVVMWWLRRPARALRVGAPPRPDQVPLARGVVLAALALSMAFPMLGLTLLAVVLVDLLVFGNLPGLRRALS